MSRFWNGGDSSSEDEKSSDSDSFEEQRVIQKTTDRKFAAAAFDESDSESEDEVRVVKSQKDRTWDSIKDAIAKIKNARKNSDWPLIQDEFNSANKLIEKNKMLVIKNGIPPFYIKMLAELEEHVSAALKDKEAQKKMKPVVSRALNQMKLQVRKHNENYKDEIADFKQNPEKYEDQQDSSSDEESEEDESDDSDSDSDESESEKDSDESSVDSLFKDADSEEDSDSESDDDTKQLTGRARWLKKVPSEPQQKEIKKEIKKSNAPKIQKEKKFLDDKPKRPVSWLTEDKMTIEDLDKKVNELVGSRGRKGFDSREVLRQLEVLTKASKLHGITKEIPVLMHFISAVFDSQRSIDDFMEHNLWRICYRSLCRVLDLLILNDKVTLSALGSEDLADMAVQTAKSDNRVSSEETLKNADPNKIGVVGSIESFIIRLEEDYVKSLQQINPHTKEYVERLADEAFLVELEEKAFSYYTRINDMKSASIISLMITEHLYYKHSIHAKAVSQAHEFNKKWGSYSDLHPACKGKTLDLNEIPNNQITHPASYLGNPTAPVVETDFTLRLEECCNFIFKYGDERSKTRALLCLVFHHALHDKYYQARDLFLISHIQEFIDKAEIQTQILYNRTMVTLGLCAFRHGLFAKAHDCLSTICSGKAKELLAQGTNRSSDKDPEQEKIERRRQMPYHMHINPDLLECCHLLCGLILELPVLAKGGITMGGQNVISRQLRKFLTNYNRQSFTGPPETTREHVLAAAKAILGGEWKTACNYLLNLEVWNLIPGDGGNKIRQMLRARIQEEAIRCHLLLNLESYESLSLECLCAMFEMETNQVRKIICQMIFHKEIAAYWENSGKYLVLFKIDASPLQVQSIGIAEKLTQLLESNERIVDSMVGVYGYKDEWNSRDNNRKFNQDNNSNKKFLKTGVRHHHPAITKTNQKYNQKHVVKTRQPYNKNGGNYSNNNNYSNKESGSGNQKNAWANGAKKKQYGGYNNNNSNNQNNNPSDNSKQ